MFVKLWLIDTPTTDHLSSRIRMAVTKAEAPEEVIIRPERALIVNVEKISTIITHLLPSNSVLSPRTITIDELQLSVSEKAYNLILDSIKITE